MDSYEIIMTPDATADLVELRDYIADVLLVPGTALSYIRTIREEISKLAEMPGRIKPVDDEPWHSRGIRKIIAKNFYVYYRIDEDAKRVYIMNVIYNKRDQLRQLSQMKLD
uniref:type II toxin-antitoxin system RelE/ParE family toxin n=1 Tax=Eubacterium cellulosolvens TaxID=29322 RepID=UPI0004898E06|nr:type II toxin-antitoxin system RelE/ParE family toxin [[Eubacterium] cellulosolvens]